MAISAQHTKFVYPDYISSLPSEDLIKVALYKQQMFDEGVNKVQTQVDSYAQLRNDIYTPIEQKYFDETMTNLVKSVNDSAGIDFSKKANVQAVLGIGKPLERDTNIINAIQNGKEIKKRYQTLSEIDQDKRSTTNDWAYTNDIDNYLKANKLGMSVQKNKQYEEYVDISEMVVDLVKELSPLEQEQFIGKTDGTPQGYLEVITKQGFDQTQLANRIKGMLSTDPKAARQLQIDTEYYYNRMGPERAYQAYVGDQTEKAAVITDRVQKTEQQLATLKQSNRNINSPSINTDIKKLENELKFFKQSEAVALQNSSKRFEEFNPSDYFETFQNQFVTNLANTYSVQKVSRDLKNDKIWDVLQNRQMEYFKFNLDMKKGDAEKQTEKLNTYNRMTKQLVVDIPNAKSVIQNVSRDKTRINLQMIENAAREDGNSGSAENISKFLTLIDRAYKLKGTAQLNTLANALTIIKKGNSLNAKYKGAVAQALGLDVEAYGQNAYSTLMDAAYSQIKSLAADRKGIDSRTPISFNYGFDNSLGAFDSINFMLNSNELGDQFAIGMPPQTVSSEMTNTADGSITTTSTKYGSEPPKPLKD